MSQATCAGSLQLCALRVCELDLTGVPNPGAGNLYVTNQAITLGIESEITEGEDLEQKNGCGDIVVTFKDRDRIKRLNLTLDLSIPDPELTELLAGGSVITDGAGNATGYAYPRIDNQPTRGGVGIEAFTKRIVNGALATDYPYWRWIIGKSDWAIGSRTLANEIMVTSFTGIAYQNENYSNGPANDIPASVPTNRLLSYHSVATIPATSCGAASLVAS